MRHMPRHRRQEQTDWRWFILGCVLLAAALIAFFWAFSLDYLSPSRRFLLMWLLPLVSGFACGCFAGSLKVSGPAGNLAIAATGGFAVWLLSFYLLPRIPDVAPSSPDSVTISLPAEMTFRQAAEMIAENDNQTATFHDCLEPLLNAKLRGGTISGTTHTNVLETLKYRLSAPNDSFVYRVVHVQHRGIYEIDCSL
jgi:hypothetical protein